MNYEIEPGLDSVNFKFINVGNNEHSQLRSEIGECLKRNENYKKAINFVYVGSFDLKSADMGVVASSYNEICKLRGLSSGTKLGDFSIYSDDTNKELFEKVNIKQLVGVESINDLEKRTIEYDSEHNLFVLFRNHGLSYNHLKDYVIEKINSLKNLSVEHNFAFSGIYAPKSDEVGLILKVREYLNNQGVEKPKINFIIDEKIKDDFFYFKTGEEFGLFTLDEYL